MILTTRQLNKQRRLFSNKISDLVSELKSTIVNKQIRELRNSVNRVDNQLIKKKNEIENLPENPFIMFHTPPRKDTDIETEELSAVSSMETVKKPTAPQSPEPTFQQAQTRQQEQAPQPQQKQGWPNNNQIFKRELIDYHRK